MDDTFNTLCRNVIENKKLKKKKKNDKLLCYTIGETDPTLRAIKKLQKSCKYFANKKIMLNIQKYLNK